jgi:ATP adenylyltransferase
MIAPRAHKAQLKDLDKDELLELMLLTIKMQEWIKKVLKPDGFNIGINIGRIAGAGVVDHLHIHIVPRWNGDTNFMPIFTNTKVVSRAIDNLYVLLRKKNDEN